MYRPSNCLLNQLNVHYITIVKICHAYLHVCHVQINFLELTGLRCNSSGYLKTLVTCIVFTQMKGYDSKQYNVLTCLYIMLFYIVML